MGVVLRAHQRSLRRDVALKVLLAGAKASERQVKRFLREAGALAKLQHPNIVRVYDTGEFGDHLYFTMELVEGQSLADLVDNKRLSLRRSVEVARDVALGLQHAHEREIIHRDIKPDNILIDPGGTPLITDFGLVRDTSLDESRLTKSGAVLGTPYYMSPEQASGQGHDLTGGADLYSLGVMLFQMLTGELPFKAQTQIELCKMIVQDTPPRPSSLNPATKGDLDAIVLKCLEKTPERRYTTAGDLADDLDRYLRGVPVLARRRGIPPTVQLGAAAIGLALVGAGITAAIFSVHRRRSTTETPVASATLTPGASLGVRGGGDARADVERLQGEVEVLPAGEDYRAKLRQLVDACGQVLGQDPKRGPIRLIRGVAQARLQRLEEAASDFRLLAKEEPGALGAEGAYRAARLGARQGSANDTALTDRLDKWLLDHPASPADEAWHGLCSVLVRKLRKPNIKKATQLIAELRVITARKGTWQASAWGLLGAIAFNNDEHELAFEALNRGIELDRRMAVAWGSRAHFHLLVKNDETRATSDLEQALKLDPGEPASLQLRANLRMMRRDTHGALRDLEMARKRSPNNANLVVNIVVIMRRLDQDARADALLREALIRWPEDPAVVNVVTNDALRRDDLNAAFKTLEGGLDLLELGSEDFGRVRRRYEDLITSTRELDRGEAYCEKRRARNPKDEFALALRGTLLLFRSGPQAAYDLWEPALVQHPKSTLILRHLIRAKLSTVKSDAELRDWAIRIQEAGPDDPEAQAFSVITLMQLKTVNVSEVEALSSRLAVRYPADPNVLAARALVLANDNRIDQALSFLERAQRLEPENFQVSMLTGQILARKGRLEAAGREFRSGLFVNPYRQELLTVYTKVLRQAKDWGRLIKFVGSCQERFEKIDKVNLPMSSHFDAIHALLQKGDSQQATRILKGFESQLPPEAIEPRLEIARFMAMAGLLDDARRVVKGVLKLEPDNPKAKDLWEKLNR